MGDVCISAPFAIVLVVFDRHKRSKLNADALIKVAKKYGGSTEKQEQLLSDLVKKYTDIPTTVSLSQLSRILAIYDIPQVIRNHFKGYAIPAYDPRLDILSSHFDPLKALLLSSREKGVLSSLSPTDHSGPGGSTKPRDNMAKLKHFMVFDEQADSAKICASSSSSSSTTTAVAVATVSVAVTSAVPVAIALSSSAYTDLANAPAIFKPPPSVIKEVHPFERIAIQTLQNGGKNKQDPKCTGQLATDPAKAGEGSTYAMLYAIMQEKCRAHVIIRRRNSVRGYLIGNIIAFDRHFNLIMRNVTEEMITVPEPAGNYDDEDFSANLYTGSVRASNGNTSIGVNSSGSAVRNPTVASSSLAPPFAVVIGNQNLCHRQLPQLLVRGDSIVCVYRARR